MKVRTKIWLRDNWHNVNADKPPKETRVLDSFLYFNDSPKCFLKTQGGWYKLTREGSLVFVARALYLLTLKEWLEIARNDYFIENNR